MMLLLRASRSFAVGVAFLLLTGCIAETIVGSGNPGQVTVDIANVDKVEINAAGKVSIVVGSEEFVKVTGDDNILENLESNQSGSTFTSRPKQNKNLKPELPLVYEIQVLSLEAVKLDGTLISIISGVSGSDFSFTSTGVCETEITGSVQRFDLNLDGDSELNAKSLVANDVNLLMTGVSSATINVSSSLTGLLASFGNVRYFGNPVIAVQQTQFGKLIKGIELN